MIHVLTSAWAGLLFVLFLLLCLGSLGLLVWLLVRDRNETLTDMLRSPGRITTIVWAVLAGALVYFVFTGDWHGIAASMALAVAFKLALRGGFLRESGQTPASPSSMTEVSSGRLETVAGAFADSGRIMVVVWASLVGALVFCLLTGQGRAIPVILALVVAFTLATRGRLMRKSGEMPKAPPPMVVPPPVMHTTPPASPPRQCPQCGTSLAPDAPQGLCPACLLKRGLETQGGAGEAGAASPTPGYVPPTPAELARYLPELEILELIGRGGMGVVYKARQKRLDLPVALKILPASVSRDPAFAERFAREARALAYLNHPNIVTVHDFGQADGLFYFVMEFVDGANLRQLLNTAKITPKEALAIVPQICDALQYAHDKGIVHRDIKPENILLDKNGAVKIADFGLAKLMGHGAKDLTITGTGEVMGTPQYMAPEQVEHPQDVDHRADIYSLGVVFYQMLTGELPMGRFAPPSSCVRGMRIDVRLDEVVLRALEKEPERRYQQASQVKTDVETIAATLPPLAGFAAKAGAVPPPFPITARKATSDKTILPAFLLAFFFGVFGAHRFYVGKTGTAILQLCTFGGCGIWATIDWILILCKAFTDGEGRRITHWLHPTAGESQTAVSPVTGPPSTPARIWPWLLGAAVTVGVIIIGLMIMWFAWSSAGGRPNVTVTGIVTDAATGQPIVGACVSDNRYGAGANKAPQQAWADGSGRYELRTWNEEHTIAASAPGYETKPAALMTESFGRAREIRMDFQLQPTNSSPATASAELPPEQEVQGKLGELYARWIGILGGFLTKDEVRQDFNQTLPLAADGRLSLDNVNGRIEIIGWNRDEVVIKAVKRGKTRESVEAVQIEVEARSGRIAIHTRQPASRFWFWWRRDNVSVDYTIQVPQRARLEKITSVNGKIVIERVDGDVEATTVNGEVKTKGAAGNVKLSTVNGSVAAELDSLGGGQSVSLETVNGRIEVTLPAAADAEVSATAVNGSITSDYSSLAVKKEFPIGSTLKGTLGNGGARVKASAVNGSISFRRNTTAK